MKSSLVVGSSGLLAACSDSLSGQHFNLFTQKIHLICNSSSSLQDSHSAQLWFTSIRFPGYKIHVSCVFPAIWITSIWDLTGGSWWPPTVTLNKSPAWVLPGKEFRDEALSFLLTELLRESFMSWSITLFGVNFEADAGDPFPEPSLSTFGDNPSILSGFCVSSKYCWLDNNIHKILNSHKIYIEQYQLPNPNPHKIQLGRKSLIFSDLLFMNWGFCILLFYTLILTSVLINQLVNYFNIKLI